MSKQRILMIVALCFVLIGTVAAGIPHEPKPDSVVSCFGVGGSFMFVDTHSVPVSIDSTEWCARPAAGQNTCSPCVRSLEHQGCDVLDVDTFDVTDEQRASKAIFVLSCAGP
jgi:hypothetical protein